MSACPFVCAAGRPGERLRAGENDINRVGSYPWQKYHSQGEKTRPVTTWRGHFSVCYALLGSAVENPLGLPKSSGKSLGFPHPEIPAVTRHKFFELLPLLCRLKSYIYHISASCKKEHLILRIRKWEHWAWKPLLPAGKWESGRNNLIRPLLSQNVQLLYDMYRKAMPVFTVGSIYVLSCINTEKSRAKNEENKVLITWLLGITADHSVPHLEYYSLSLYLSKFTGKEHCSSLQLGSVKFWNNIACLQVTHRSRMMNK